MILIPQEIQDRILLNLNFKKVISLNNHYLAKKIYNPIIHTWDQAASNGHLDVVKWLHENKKEGCTKDAMDLASGNGYLDVVIWLHENRKEGCTKDAMDRAAKMDISM